MNVTPVTYADTAVAKVVGIRRLRALLATLPIPAVIRTPAASAVDEVKVVRPTPVASKEISSDMQLFMLYACQFDVT